MPAWVESAVSTSPRIARTIWTPAGAHQSARASDAKTAFGSGTMSTSIAIRFGGGVGVGVGSGVGDGVAPGGNGAGVGVGDGLGVTGGSVTLTVPRVGRSGTGPAMNRSTRWTTANQA